jgi:hypothetical protein
MTIRSCINARALNERWTKIERAIECAPEGTFEHTKAVAEIVTETANSLIKASAAAGLKVNNSDQLREVEAVVYGWIVDAQEPGELIAAEGFGEAMDGPAAARVLAGITRDRDFLRQLHA